MQACVDIGGTKVAASLVQPGADLSRTLVHRQSEPTVKEGARTALAGQVLRLVDRACAQAGIPASAITEVAVSSTGPFRLHGGRAELVTPNICGGMGEPGRLPNDWTSVPMEAPLAERFPAVRMENDGIAALEAERRWGALQGLDHCAYVTWSTGVGTGLCVGGRVLRGKNGNAGHAGHSYVADADPQALCGCGNRGDLESLVSGTAIRRRFGDRWPGASALMEAAGSGDAAALAVVDDLCRVLGRALYNLAVTLDLQRISLGGSVFLHHQALLLPRLQAQLRGRLPALTDGCDIVAAGLGERVGDYAALALLAAP
ncbi:ROK family protein [Ramlibacter tataouinensis]|uniref:N-acetylmannosamine kinase(ManNAc kinase)-like protein n=1 Tax=Ramlibacter tataouinensis (strain ATCC BAA-407 / DSM 14655 / LMG 21543 / TTB310) TaxID=365046 RepID=F5XXL2_RAMTT|nr:ROK family protein [Ramlibacter tataouinensis]AEG91815.1 N-acetylmannosamine kinase(ManNAc kinase)-like protein [Ramlibacter tataouinensis TTB310]